MTGQCTRTIWGLASGLRCIGSGVGHTHRFEASSAPDRHTAEVQES